MFEKIKGYFTDKLVKSYLLQLVKRLDGYKTFLGIGLTLLQIASHLLDKNVPILATIIGVLQEGDVTTIVPEGDIGILATSLLALWGLIMKVYKASKGLPQVPELTKK